MKTNLEKLAELEIRMNEAIEIDMCAQRGSDKTWKRECKKEIVNIRNLIWNILASEK